MRPRVARAATAKAIVSLAAAVLLRRQRLPARWLAAAAAALLGWAVRRIRRSRLRCQLGRFDPFFRDGSFHRKYTLDKNIAESTFGRVYDLLGGPDRGAAGAALVAKVVPRLEHPLLGEMLANGKRKRMTSPTETDEFHLYMASLLKLSHTNVVRYRHFFADTDNFYYVMEKVPGVTLLESLARRAHWTEPLARRLMRQLLEALKYVHTQKLIHRDVKLENLVVENGPHIEHLYDGKKAHLRLVDFGLGCQKGNAVGLVGTPGYMAPEIFERYQQGYNDKVDVFAAGVILNILLTGEPPFSMPLSVNSLTCLQDHVEKLHDGIDITKLDEMNMSEHAKHVLARMLLPSDWKRPSAAGCLRFDWFDINFMPSDHTLWDQNSEDGVRFLEALGLWPGSSCGGNKSGVLAREGMPIVSELVDHAKTIKPTGAFAEDVAAGWLQKAYRALPRAPAPWSARGAFRNMDRAPETDNLPSKLKSIGHLLPRLNPIVRRMLPNTFLAYGSPEDAVVVAVSKGLEKILAKDNSQLFGKNLVASIFGEDNSTLPERDLHEGSCETHHERLLDELRQVSGGADTFHVIKSNGTACAYMLHLSKMTVVNHEFFLGIFLQVHENLKEMNEKADEVSQQTRKAVMGINYFMELS
eukprot:TRINITY_DN24511_c0_g1_i1.p1 TRINITY_DN24511_c0_g1~~TRINITY_DN24511_c0_g1_i1.p1  ORF type:complete len:640 (-),score=120.63 TRINITY_DN24511_c0_g1_i1:44-1963(-)